MKCECYKDRKGEYRARITAKNGKVLLVSSEGYKRKPDLERALKSTLKDTVKVEWLPEPVKKKAAKKTAKKKGQPIQFDVVDDGSGRRVVKATVR